MRKFILAVIAVGLMAFSVHAANIELQWVDNVANEQGYKVYTCGTSMGPCSAIICDLPVNATACTDLNVTEGTHHYRVTAYRGGAMIHSAIFGATHTPLSGTVDSPTAVVIE